MTKGISRSAFKGKKSKKISEDERIRKGKSRTRISKKKPKRKGRRRDRGATKERA